MKTLMLSSAAAFTALVWSPGLAADQMKLIAEGPIPDLGPVATYYHFDEPRELVPDGSRIAILRSTQRAADDAVFHADLLSLGVRPESAQASAIAGWHFVDAPADARGFAATTDLARAAGELESIDYASPVFVDNLGGPLVPTNTVLVRFEDETPALEAKQLIEQSMPGAIIIEEGWAGWERAYRVLSPFRSGDQTLASANALARRPETIFSHPDMMFTGRSAVTIPNDTFWTFLWGLNNTGQDGGTFDIDMDIPEAWDITTGDPGIKVLVIDVGVDLTHQDLSMLPGIDTTSDPGSGGIVNSCDWHGSWVAGCIGAIFDNSEGVVGAAPGCGVASARCFISDLACDGSWTSFGSWTTNALTFAENNGFRVTNNSNSYGFTDSGIESKYASTRNNGMVHFASSGNASGPSPLYPSSLTTVVAVGNVTRTGAINSSSNAGVAISAPGTAIGTTDNVGSSGGVSGDYASVTGTSFASPYTAAVAALVLSLDSTLTAAEVEAILEDTAVDLGVPGDDTLFGAGMVNAFNAVTAAAALCPTDFDGDGETGASDLSVVLANWGVPGNPLADLANDDNIVEAADLSVLLANWGPCP